MMFRSVATLASRRLIASSNVAPKVLYQPTQLLGTVKENTIKITFVDSEGNRATLPCRVGHTLFEAARMQKIDIEGPCRGGGGRTDAQRTKDWNETLFGSGPTCFYCHVQIPLQYHHLLPQPQETESDGIKEVWEEEHNVSSRLACQIILEKKHDGMVVFVPDAPPTNVI